MTRKLFILPFILLFISCTVTKRVHRPGYHVQWHKVQRSQNTDKEDGTDQITAKKDRPRADTKEEAHLDLQAEIVDSIDHKPSELAEKSTILDGKSKKIIDFKQILPFPKDVTFKAFGKTTTEHQKAKTNHQSRPIFWRMSAKNLKFIGLFFIWFGGLLLLGSILVYAGAFTGNSGGAWANFFIDLINISGWFWLLVFILAIVLVFYIATILVRYVFGGPLIGAIVGLSLLVIGVFFYALGDRRDIEA